MKSLCVALGTTLDIDVNVFWFCDPLVGIPAVSIEE